LRNISSILTDGIQPPSSSYRDNIDQDLIEVVAENGTDLPIDRQNCVFFYPALGPAASTLTPTNDEGEAVLGKPEGVVVVDETQVESDLFVGEFRLISDAIDFQFREEPDDAMISASYNDALRRYADSLTLIGAGNSLETVCEQFKMPEVIVEGTVGPQTVVSVLCGGHPRIEHYQ
jgi:hypothetical protein